MKKFEKANLVELDVKCTCNGGKPCIFQGFMGVNAVCYEDGYPCKDNPNWLQGYPCPGLTNNTPINPIGPEESHS